MSGRAKAGGAMMLLGYLVYLIAGMLALGSMFNACVVLAQGSLASFIFSVGFAVVIGWLGQFFGGLVMAGGAAVSGDE